MTNAPLDDEVKLWDLPDVEVNHDDGQTNALNKPRGKWKFEAPEQEEELSPLTAKDIEDIRKAAYEEGHSAGKEQGYQDGHAEGLEKGQSDGLELGKTAGAQQSKEEADAQAKIHVEALNIEESLVALPINESSYQIYLNSEDLAALSEHLSKHEEAKSWALTLDHQMQRGGCKIVSQNNAVDMSITRRCEQVFEKLLLEQGLSDDPRAS